MFHPISAVLLMQCVAYSAMTLTRVGVSVRFRKPMAPLALYFPRIDSRQPYPPQHILAPRHHLQVFWIHASSVPAHMVDRHSFFNAPDVEFIRSPVGHYIPSFFISF